MNALVKKTKTFNERLTAETNTTHLLALKSICPYACVRLMHTAIYISMNVYVVPPCHSMSLVEKLSASGDYLSPWELDGRRGGLIAASCAGFEG